MKILILLALAAVTVAEQITENSEDTYNTRIIYSVNNLGGIPLYPFDAINFGNYGRFVRLPPLMSAKNPDSVIEEKPDGWGYSENPDEQANEDSTRSADDYSQQNEEIRENLGEESTYSGRKSDMKTEGDVSETVSQSQSGTNSYAEDIIEDLTVEDTVESPSQSVASNAEDMPEDVSSDFIDEYSGNRDISETLELYVTDDINEDNNEGEHTSKTSEVSMSEKSSGEQFSNYAEDVFDYADAEAYVDDEQKSNADDNSKSSPVQTDSSQSSSSASESSKQSSSYDSSETRESMSQLSDKSTSNTASQKQSQSDSESVATVTEKSASSSATSSDSSSSAASTKESYSFSDSYSYEWSFGEMVAMDPEETGSSSSNSEPGCSLSNPEHTSQTSMEASGTTTDEELSEKTTSSGDAQKVYEPVDQSKQRLNFDEIRKGLEKGYKDLAAMKKRMFKKADVKDELSQIITELEGLCENICSAIPEEYMIKKRSLN